MRGFRSAAVAAAVLGIAAVGCNGETVQPPPGSIDGGVSDSGGGGGAGGEIGVRCDNPAIQPPASGTCEVVRSGTGGLLIRGDLAGPDGIIVNGQLLIGTGGKITCAACDCSSSPGFADATELACAQALITPGLINGHDHVGWIENAPVAHGETRYDHRHDWRTGRDAISRPQNQGGNRGVRWGELRQLMAGTTSINGSGGATGLLRNLDRGGEQSEGLDLPRVIYSTFPLGDSNGTKRTSGCNYSFADSPTDSDIMAGVAYAPHISEGVDLAAHNEFLCLSGSGMGAIDLLLDKTAIIHGIGLVAADYASMSAAGASLIWSARTNIDLYGHTAQVTTAARLGVRIGLGTDWTISGSMNMLRELRCTDELNRRNFGRYFNDRQLVEMTTSGIAGALGAGQRLGRLAAGYEADVAIFDASQHKGYRAVIDAEAPDVVLVFRGGAALYGDATLVETLAGENGCEAIDVCGRGKRACVERDTGDTIADLRGAISQDAYDLFYCGAPPDEPTCIPFRQGEYDGMASQDDNDGDGIGNDRDLCPRVFDPVRPLDDMAQADGDGDMIGDACDPCPLDAMVDNCMPPDPNDRDGDGRTDDADNCPSVANADQADRDMDQTGDACDACPDQSNPNGAACEFSVYAIKQKMAEGRVKISNLTVTAVGPTGWFAQVGPDSPGYEEELGARWSGIFVYDPGMMRPAQGDLVDVEGDVLEYYGQIQLGSPRVTAKGTAAMMPPPIFAEPEEVKTGGAAAAELEGVLLEVQDVTVTEVEPPPGPGEQAPTEAFIVQGGLRIDDYFFDLNPPAHVGERLSYVRGILRFANDSSKLEPRNADDVGTPVELLGLDPTRVFLGAGAMGTPLSVVLTRSSTAAVVVTLSTSDSAVAGVPAAVTVPAGMIRAPVALNGGRTGPATITARFGTVTATAGVLVYDDASPRAIASLTLDETRLPVADDTQGRLTLSLPAPSTGLAVRLSVEPANLATVTATVTIPAGQIAVDVMLATETSTGSGLLVATLGGARTTVAFDVVRSITRTPRPGDLVITEVHKNPSGTNEKVREWFEVYNPTEDEIQIHQLLTYDNGGPSRGHTIQGQTLVIPAKGHAVIAYSADMAMNGGVDAIAAYGAEDIQLANTADSVTLSFGGEVIDAVTWTASWPGDNGVTMCLKFPYGDNSVSDSWSESAGTFGTGDSGSPGVANDDQNCP